MQVFPEAMKVGEQDAHVSAISHLWQWVAEQVTH